MVLNLNNSNYVVHIDQLMPEIIYLGHFYQCVTKLKVILSFMKIEEIKYCISKSKLTINTGLCRTINIKMSISSTEFHSF